MVSMLGNAGYNQNMPMEKAARVTSYALAVSTQERKVGWRVGEGIGKGAVPVIQLKMSRSDKGVIA